MRVIALVIVILITYLSNTPHLSVLDVNTWFNSGKYENIRFSDIVSKNTLFLDPWEKTYDLDFYLHKLGHFSFYGFLAIFLFWRSSSYRKALLKLLLIVGFAFTDEVHQYFVVGRSGRLMDVLFDLFSVSIFLLILSISGNLKTQKNKIENNKKTEV
ncbi:VanZ family protein [Bacillus mexicanus]|uniref:VanZ family protein n=1 Tax=Bacillus mexicanus TaxID=2834415 RepID=UPI003D22FA2D